MRPTKDQSKKRNEEILKGYREKQLKIKELSEIFCVSTTTVRNVIKRNEPNFIKNKSNKTEKHYGPFKPNLKEGQKVILLEFKGEKSRTSSKAIKRVYEVLGVYPHHVMFERPGKNGTTITVDYTNAELRNILRYIKADQAAG